MLAGCRSAWATACRIFFLVRSSPESTLRFLVTRFACLPDWDGLPPLREASSFRSNERTSAIVGNSIMIMIEIVMVLRNIREMIMGRKKKSPNLERVINVGIRDLTDLETKKAERAKR